MQGRALEVTYDSVQLPHPSEQKGHIDCGVFNLLCLVVLTSSRFIETCIMMLLLRAGDKTNCYCLFSALLEKPLSKRRDSEATQKAKIFYISCMNESKYLALKMYLDHIVQYISLDTVYVKMEHYLNISGKLKPKLTN